MRKSISQVRIGDNLLRFKIRIEDSVSEFGTLACRARQRAFLRELVDNEGILACGTSDFQKMHMFHDGKAWVVEAEAEVEMEQ